MKEQMLSLAIQMLLKVVSEEMLKDVADMILDFVEDKVADSSNTLDDMTVLPVVAVIRKTFNIPDND